MSIKEHPKFDETGYLKINDNHLMVFLHADGFTERLLGLSIFVTKSYEIEVYLRSFLKGNDYGGFKTEYVIKDVPKEIIVFLNQLSEIDNADFGFNKKKRAMLDCESQDFLFNYKGKTLGFDISGGMTINLKDFKTELGKGFFALYLFMNEWMEELYEDFNKSDG